MLRGNAARESACNVQAAAVIELFASGESSLPPLSLVDAAAILASSARLFAFAFAFIWILHVSVYSRATMWSSVLVREPLIVLSLSLFLFNAAA